MRVLCQNWQEVKLRACLVLSDKTVPNHSRVVLNTLIRWAVSGGPGKKSYARAGLITSINSILEDGLRSARKMANSCAANEQNWQCSRPL